MKVKDRMVIKTTDFERECTAPEGLQLEINKLMSNISAGRAFVRFYIANTLIGHKFNYCIMLCTGLQELRMWLECMQKLKLR